MESSLWQNSLHRLIYVFFFQDNNSLRLLDLSANGIDDIAANCLGKAVATNRYLTELNLNSNRIGIDGVKTLFTHLGKNESLKILRVGVLLVML